MRIVVIGATGGTGRATVTELLERGHEVVAVSRHASGLAAHLRLTPIDADATVAGALDAAVRGADAVVVALGITESPVGVRLRGARDTADDIRSAGTAETIAAMRRTGVGRLVVQSSYGVGPTRELLPWVTRLVFAVLLKPQIADHERQERLVRDSGLDWVIAQPVNLTDADQSGGMLASEDGTTDAMKVSRPQVASFLADAAEGLVPAGRTVALSATTQAPAFAQ